MNWNLWAKEELERVKQEITSCDDPLVLKILTVYYGQITHLVNSMSNGVCDDSTLQF